MDIRTIGNIVLHTGMRVDFQFSGLWDKGVH